jgi:hypothetical protein
LPRSVAGLVLDTSFTGTKQTIWPKFNIDRYEFSSTDIPVIYRCNRVVSEQQSEALRRAND